MGTWGAGNFQNDSVMDYVYDSDIQGELRCL